MQCVVCPPLLCGLCWLCGGVLCVVCCVVLLCCCRCVLHVLCCPVVPFFFVCSCRGLLGGDENLRDRGGVAYTSGAARGALQETWESLEFGSRDCPAAVEASVAREFRSQHAPKIDNDEPVAATAEARVTRLVASGTVVCATDAGKSV